MLFHAVSSIKLRRGDKRRVPDVPLWGSPQQGCCGLGSMDGLTPTPQGYIRWPVRTNATQANPNSNLSCNATLSIGAFEAAQLVIAAIGCGVQRFFSRRFAVPDGFERFIDDAANLREVTEAQAA